MTTTTTTTVGTSRPRGVRGYTYKFTPADKGKRYLLDRIPARLWISARAQAKREGLSMRALVLQLLTNYVERPS